MHQRPFASIFNASVYGNKANQSDHGAIKDVAHMENMGNGDAKRLKLVYLEGNELPEKNMNSNNSRDDASQGSSIDKIHRVLSTSNLINTLDSEHLTGSNLKRYPLPQQWKTSTRKCERFVPQNRKSIDVVRRVLNASVCNELEADEYDSPKPLCKANSAPLMATQSFPIRSEAKTQTAENEMILDGSPTKNTAEPSELDLLLQLIETENNAKCTPTQTRELFERTACQPMGSQSQKPKIRRCLKNGHLEKLQCTLQRLAKDSKYLEQDNCLGLVEGVPVTVVSLDVSFNVYIATVRPDDDECHYRALLEPHIGQQVYPGRRLQVFFDQLPYQLGATKLPIFVQPHKVIMIDH